MKRANLAVVVISAMVCAMAFGGDALARGGGGGLRLRDGSCVKNQTAVSTQTKTQVRTMKRQRLLDGNAATSGVTQQGQGNMRRLGPGDGTGNITPPLDGTGYGSPAKR